MWVFNQHESRFCSGCGSEQLEFVKKDNNEKSEFEEKQNTSPNIETVTIDKTDIKSKWNIWLVIIGILVLSSIIFNVNKVKCISCSGTGRNDELGAGGICKYCEGSGNVPKSVNKRNFGIEELK